MSGPALSFVMTALSAKTVIDGIKEGNLLKAVVGGVGAYMGASNLAAAGAEGAQAATYEGLSTEAGASAAEGIVGEGAQAAGEMGTNAATASAAEGAAAESATQGLETVATNPVSGGTVAAEQSKGILGGLGDWWGKQDGMTKSGLMQMGGGILQGHSQEELLKDKWDREERLLEEERRRRATTATVQPYAGNKWVPQVGWIQKGQ